MFVVVKCEFGFTTQSNLMFIAINIECDCVLQPNWAFNGMNTEFG